MKKLAFLSLIAVLTLAACQKAPEAVIEAPPPPPIIDPGFPIVCDENCAEGVYAYYLGKRLYLYGGDDSSWDFDITNWSLELSQLHAYGYDRETIMALIQPQYQTIQEAADRYELDEPVIYLHTELGIKVYPYILMRFHEVINEFANGQPVMIAYCYLADLAAVYSRNYCGQTLTFGVSGYTYSDPNIWKESRGFILWDRDTESLWWPLIDRAVSGLMQNTLLQTHNEELWGLSTWAEMLDQHPDALVMKQGQNMIPPTNWNELQEEDLDCD